MHQPCTPTAAQLKKLPGFVFDVAERARTLDAANNEIAAIPAGISRLKALERLKMPQNQLSSLPPELFSLSALKTIDLSGNRVIALPAALGALIALEGKFG